MLKRRYREFQKCKLYFNWGKLALSFPKSVKWISEGKNLTVYTGAVRVQEANFSQSWITCKVIKLKEI